MLERIAYFLLNLLLHRPAIDAFQERVKAFHRVQLLPGLALGDRTIAGLAVVAGAAVGAIAIHPRLDERGALAALRARHGLPRRVEDVEHVHAVDAHRGHGVRPGPAVELAR